MNSHIGISLSERIEALEKQNHRFKVAGVTLGVILIAVVVMGQGAPRKTLDADELLIRDANGRVRIKLSVDVKSDTPEVNLFDGTGNVRTKLQSGGMSLYDTEKRERGTFLVNEFAGSSAMLALFHEDGKAGTLVRENDLLSPDVVGLTSKSEEFILLDEKGNTRARLFMTKKKTFNTSLPGSSELVQEIYNPEPTLTFYDDKSQPKCIVNSSDIAFFDSEGLGNASLGNGTLSLNGKGGANAMLAPGKAMLLDDQGFSTLLGVQNLESGRTGQTIRTSAASLVMFDSNKHAIWKAP